MANDDAWQGGLDIAQKHRDKRMWDQPKQKQNKKDVKEITTSSGQKLYPTPSYKHGGKVKRTGLARLHKNERVLTVKQAKAYKGKKKAARKRVARKG